MNLTHLHRTAAAGALAAMLAAGAGVAAIGSGAIALGGGNGGAAIVTHAAGQVTVTLGGDELHQVATDPAYSKQVCADPQLSLVRTSCELRLPECASQWEKTPTTITAVYDKNTGREVACKPPAST